jgi:hypothetical protein
MLERNADGSLNFPAPRVMSADSPAQMVTKRQLKDGVREVFEDDAELALVYSRAMATSTPQVDSCAQATLRPAMTGCRCRS